MLAIKKRHWLEIALHLLFWIGVFYALTALTSTSMTVRLNHNGVIMERNEEHSLSPYSFFTLACLMLLFYSNSFWLFKKIMRYPGGIKRLVIVAGWFVLIFIANFLIIYFLVGLSKPAPDNVPIFGSTNPVNFTAHSWQRLQLIILLIFLSVLGLSLAYFFSKEWIRNELVRKQMAAMQLSTELKFLKSQINPHFLFNTLNNLFSMAQDKGNDELADGISKLSEMMRYMIYESNAEYVPLNKEIEYLKNCIVLNKLRYADHEASVNFKYPLQAPNLFVSPMLFIPFVENAFKHGVVIGQSSYIDISVSVADKQVLFSCENKNYSFVKKMDEASGIGLENVKRRLDLVYPGKYELVIKNDEDKFAVTLKINLA
jgi:two-component system LytT family sensor kinase